MTLPCRRCGHTRTVSSTTINARSVCRRCYNEIRWGGQPNRVDLSCREDAIERRYRLARAAIRRAGMFHITDEVAWSGAGQSLHAFDRVEDVGA